LEAKCINEHTLNWYKPEVFRLLVQARSTLPFDEWTSVLGSERLTGALLDRFIHHVHILEMNGESHRLAISKKWQRMSENGEAGQINTDATP
jgi:hypothetical protein